MTQIRWIYAKTYSFNQLDMKACFHYRKKWLLQLLFHNSDFFLQFWVCVTIQTFFSQLWEKKSELHDINSNVWLFSIFLAIPSLYRAILTFSSEFWVYISQFVLIFHRIKNIKKVIVTFYLTILSLYLAVLTILWDINSELWDKRDVILWRPYLDNKISRKNSRLKPKLYFNF